ncbi:alpha/beta hydrolase [Deinococcus malanensis]|uniref:Alpha/beta hydrolase n=1 Tax=Deinococcus malanensis TaxID=1706855 RepID=A0ABQ2EZ64_9DEIO|nr:alpha/beta hydrolase [Deinococcus malanensis]GGK33638.1 alpha/beta hydrolase [Deinococcus malanensis]
MPEEHTYTIEMHRKEDHGREDNARIITLHTSRGAIDARLHEPPDGPGTAGIVWVFGAGGGLGGPAGGLYTRLAGQLAPAGVTSLRLDYRQPNHLMECTLDVLVGVAFLRTLGSARLVLVGHSFGGAVVINAGANSDAVVGVAALSSQTYGAEAVRDLSPRSLLLLHGSADEVLPDACSRLLYEQAGDPKELHLFPGCRHGLDACRQEVDVTLIDWLRRTLALSPAQSL